MVFNLSGNGQEGRCGMDGGRGYSDSNIRFSPTSDELWVLMVYDEEEPVRALEDILLGQGMGTRHVRNCAEAGAALREAEPPALVLTDTSLPDGTWADVLQATRTVQPNSPIIVVSRVVDIPLYLNVLENGAHDFVVPPVSSADLAYIVRGAILEG